MQIDCPTCARSYSVGRAALGDSGRMVVCPRCDARWFVPAKDDDRPTPTEAVIGPVRTSSRPPHPFGPTPRTKTPLATAMRPIAAGIVVMSLLMLGIGKRTSIVAAAPRTAALYEAVGLPVNVRGLAFTELKTTRLDDAGQHVEITGQIRNVAAKRMPVPRMTFDIRDAHGATLASWTERAPKTMLADNESIAFTAQAPSLPAGYSDIVVQFAADATPDTLLIHKTR